MLNFDIFIYIYGATGEIDQLSTKKHSNVNIAAQRCLHFSNGGPLVLSKSVMFQHYVTCEYQHLY